MAYLDPINKYAEGIRHYNIFHKQLTRAWATTKVTSHRGESQHGCLEIPLPSFQANLSETVRWLVLILEPRASQELYFSVDNNSMNRELNLVV